MSSTILTIDAAKAVGIPVVENGRYTQALHDVVVAYRAARPAALDRQKESPRYRSSCAPCGRHATLLGPGARAGAVRKQRALSRFRDEPHALNDAPLGQHLWRSSQERMWTDAPCRAPVHLLPWNEDRVGSPLRPQGSKPAAKCTGSHLKCFTEAP